MSPVRDNITTGNVCLKRLIFFLYLFVCFQVKRLEQLFSAMANRYPHTNCSEYIKIIGIRSPTKEEIRSAPNVRRRESINVLVLQFLCDPWFAVISPEQRGDARRLSSKVAFAAQAKLGQELGRGFSGDEGSSGQDQGGENIEEVLTGKLGIREAVHAFDVLVTFITSKCRTFQQFFLVGIRTFCPILGKWRENRRRIK